MVPTEENWSQGAMNAAQEDSFALGCQLARAEARSLLPLLLAGITVEELPELISVVPRVEHELRAFARAHPEKPTGSNAVCGSGNPWGRNSSA